MPDDFVFLPFLLPLAERWWALKDGLSRAIHLPHAALHLVGGPILFALLARAYARAGAAHPARRAWLVVLLAEVANEMLDLALDVWPEGALARQGEEMLTDVLLTMAVPTLWLLLARRAHGISPDKPVAE